MSSPAQNVTVDYLAYVDSSIVNLRHKDIRPVGVYSGGYLSHNGAQVTIEAMVCEIKSSDGSSNQIRVETTASVSITPSSVNHKYVRARWTYSGNGPGINLMDVSCVELADLGDYDLILGILNISAGPTITGIAYYDVTNNLDRTIPWLPSHMLKVVPDPNSNRSVIVQRGYVEIGGQNLHIRTAVAPALSPIGIYVIIDQDGNLAVSSSLAGIETGIILGYVNTDSPVTNDSITDMRSFLTESFKCAHGKAICGGGNKSVTLDFTPKLVIAGNTESNKSAVMWMEGLDTTKMFIIGGTTGTRDTQFTVNQSNRIIAFPQSQGSRVNNNDSNDTFFYFALGGTEINPS